MPDTRVTDQAPVRKVQQVPPRERAFTPEPQRADPRRDERPPEDEKRIERYRER